MKKLVLLVFLFIFAGIIGIASILAFEQPPLPPLFEAENGVSLIRCGIRVYDGQEILLLAIRIGDVEGAEAEARYWRRAYGDYARNCADYVRTPDGGWLALIHRRPKNDDETLEFRENPEKFFSQTKVHSVRKLPHPLCLLESEDLIMVEWTRVYLDGGAMKIYLYPEYPLEKAIALTEKISSLRKK